jgi:hypothetical protein
MSFRRLQRADGQQISRNRTRLLIGYHMINVMPNDGDVSGEHALVQGSPDRDLACGNMHRPFRIKREAECSDLETKVSSRGVLLAQGRMHVPPTHEPIGPQSLPQRPQCFDSVCRSTQRSAQPTRGGSQSSTHSPSEQVLSIGQSPELQQPRHSEPQSRLPGPHSQRPIMQRAPALQLSPQAPQ